jgi:hypothetical protein
MPDDHGAWRRRVGCDALQPVRTAHPMGRQPSDLPGNVGHDGREGVVVASLDAHDARHLRRAKADREHRPKHDRHLAEDVPGMALAENALDPVDELDRFDAALENGTERARGALVRRILARRERDIRRHPCKPLTLGNVESCEDRDSGDLVGRHHERHPRRDALGAVRLSIIGAPGTAEAGSHSPRAITGTTLLRRSRRRGSPALRPQS